MNKIKIIIYWLIFLGMLTINYLSSFNVGNEADKYQPLIQPAGWAFSIWGLIYVLLLVWLVLLTIDLFKTDYKTSFGYWPAANFVLNALWIYVFSEYSKWLSTLVIIGLLITLIVLYRKVQYRSYDKIVFGIYFAWTTVATIVNIFNWVKSSGTSTVFSLNELTWTLIMLIIATLLAVYIAVKYRDFIYPMVFIFTFIAISIENGISMDVLSIVIGICITIQLIAVIYTMVRKVKIIRS
ncbi:tryptophan-rich sensory protein [Staphylococcus chromogenes]|uniref:tryptophan-rich sensory protein n=1 Tax=Staphylococcus chromogenes TaxID=46126 RepID=UPI0021CE7308|nr:tryptophan-rich sensory protein [Staphylococcus chromogenes]UXS75559.1 tryptophan-rich sensory protein [Staphylococcus chromogenes]